MILALIVLACTAFITYAWVVRGFFSALVHLACTLAAGAIAFSLWEPIGHWVLDAAPDRGALSFVRDSPWAIGLALPFAASLALLRAATNKLLPANAKCDDAFDYVGAGVCGLASAVITMGIFLLALGFLRFSPGAMGYQPVAYTTAAEGRGSVEREKMSLGILSGLMPRFDLVTARLYEKLSMTTLRTSEPMGKWYPRFDDVPWTNRLTYQGRSRNTTRKRDFNVLGWYTVGKKPEDTMWQGGSLRPLMTDMWDETGQTALETDGSAITNGYIAGFKVQLASGAKERGGQIIVGNGQVRLVVESVTDEEYKSLYPVAVVTNAGIEGVPAGQQPISARFRYNGNEVFFASVGGASDANMWFEFAVPAGFKPIGLSMKNTRWELPEGMNPTTYATAADRDAAVVALGGFMAPPATANSGQPEVENTGFVATNNIGHRIQRGSQGSLEIEREGRGSVIVDGEQTFSLRQLRESSQGLDPSLIIDRFLVTTDTVMVKVDVSINQKPSLLSAVADRASPDAPLVVEDTNGQQYEAVGYVYADSEKVKIRYTVGKPIRGLAELTRAQVMVSKSRPEQRLELLFRPTFGVKIRAFKIGNETVAELEPPLELAFRQQRR